MRESQAHTYSDLRETDRPSGPIIELSDPRSDEISGYGRRGCGSPPNVAFSTSTQDHARKAAGPGGRGCSPAANARRPGFGLKSRVRRAAGETKAPQLTLSH